MKTLTVIPLSDDNRNYLRRAIKRAGGQVAVAERAGLRQATISELLSLDPRKQRNPLEPTLARLCRALDLRYDYVPPRIALRRIRN